MITFHIQDMTCGHCASTITKAVKEAAPDATVAIDLKQHQVSIETKTMTTAELQEVLVEAGYTPVQTAVSAVREGS
ncbi:MAG: heavy-metal-associated domain-containing protein [Proteobacteria bacterium]|nr:heavy-metal-associated domain-containing protein [Pseudomonadota bacterium]